MLVALAIESSEQNDQRNRLFDHRDSHRDALIELGAESLRARRSTLLLFTLDLH